MKRKRLNLLLVCHCSLRHWPQYTYYSNQPASQPTNQIMTISTITSSLSICCRRTSSKVSCRLSTILLLLIILLNSVHLNNAADDLFTAMDTNHDHSISEAEYKIALSKLLNTDNSGGSAAQQAVTPSLGGDSKPSFSGGTPLNDKLKFHDNGTKAFFKGLFSSFSAIIATEIGDKTFFIAAVLSMRNDRMAVFGGAILALIIMTILSTLMGLVLPSLMPKKYTHIIGAILFLYFGVKLLIDSRGMEDKVSEELEEVEEELAEMNKKKSKARKKKEEEDEESDDIEVQHLDNNGDLSDTGGGAKKRRGGKSGVKHAQSSGGLSAAGDYSGSSWEAVFLQALTMTFLAEWGDRSQIATIALAAAKVSFIFCIGLRR